MISGRQSPALILDFKEYDPPNKISATCEEKTLDFLCFKTTCKLSISNLSF